jgi:DNA damage-binding protein 1
MHINAHIYRGNIFILNKASGDAATDDERSRLHPTSEFHIGDYINTFRKGSMNSQPLDQDTDQLLLELATGGTSTGELHLTAVDMSAAAVASSNSISHPCLDRFSSPLLFGTVGGMIGSIFSLTADSFTFFSCLERAIKTVIMGVGGLSHDEFRTFNNDRRASAVRNTIDGDLVEMFLDLSKEDMEQVVARLNEEFLTKSEGTPAPVTSSSTASSSSTMDAENSDSNSQRNLAIWTIEDVTLKVEEMARLH